MNKFVIAGVAAAAVIIAAVLYFALGGAEKQSITVVSWGGAYTKSQIEAYHKPFIAERDASINSVDYDGDIALVKAQVESANVQWDIVDFEVADAIRACDEGLLEKLDLADLPPAPDGTAADRDFIPGALDPCYVATIVFSHIIAYDKTQFPTTPPTSARDFFDLAAFPGKRGLRRTSPKVNLELALLADGVPSSQLYTALATPEGVDRAFAKLDSIKDEVVWWNAGAQPPQLLADGEVVMTTAYNGRIFDAMMDGKPFQIVWNNQLLDLDVWGIVKGSRNKALAWDFLKFSTATPQLAEQARFIAYAPARRSSIAIMEEKKITHVTRGVEMLPYMPTAPQNYRDAVPINHRWWADRQDDLTERWNAWLAK